jgi:hypothetical protein
MPELSPDHLARAGNGVAVLVEKRLDVERGLNVPFTIEALSCAAFVRLELGELAFPEAKHVGGNVAQASYFADAKVKLVRNVGSGGVRVSSNWLVLRHATAPDT